MFIATAFTTASQFRSSETMSWLGKQKTAYVVVLLMSTIVMTCES